MTISLLRELSTTEISMVSGGIYNLSGGFYNKDDDDPYYGLPKLPRSSKPQKPFPVENPDKPSNEPKVKIKLIIKSIPLDPYDPNKTSLKIGLKGTIRF